MKKHPMVNGHGFVICQPIPNTTVVDPLHFTVRTSKKNAIKEFIDSYSKTNNTDKWSFYYNRGYRCKRVVIKELGT